MSKQHLILNPGRDKAVRNHHHWIFSGAIKSYPEVEDGSIVQVDSAEGELLGSAYINRKSSITARMLSFGEDEAEAAIEQNLKNAIALRRLLFDEAQTNAYRLVNGEGDLLPGLVVDKYADVLVIQSSTLGMDKLKASVVNHLRQLLSPAAIYEKSTLPSRKEEGLQDAEGILAGDLPERVSIREYCIELLVDIAHSQKTGFYLDQREMRRLVGELSKGKRILNCFSYTGGYSVHALKGGASSVASVDSSEDALKLAKENLELNGFSPKDNTLYVTDALEFLRDEDLDYDFVILDPPAFAKRKEDVPQAMRGYRDINRNAISKMPKGSLLLTSSCSYHVDEALFQKLVFQAAREAKRSVKILQRHRHAYDHPINIFHPEGDYLKSLLLFVE